MEVVRSCERCGKKAVTSLQLKERPIRDFYGTTIREFFLCRNCMKLTIGEIVNKLNRSVPNDYS